MHKIWETCLTVLGQEVKTDDSKRNVVKSYYIEKRKGGSQISVKTRQYFKCICLNYSSTSC